ncbi:MAG TPA: DUF2142 domain-containing protein [Vicinamibacterales bacterium]
MSRRLICGWLLLALAIAAGNIFRAVAWTQSEGFVWGPFAATRSESITITRIGRLDLPLPRWRPFRIVLTAESHDTNRPVPVTLATDVRSGETSVPVAGPTRLEAVITADSPATEAVTLWAWTSSDGITAPVTLRVVGGEPVLSFHSVAIHGSIGAAAGLALAILLWPPLRRERVTAPPTVRDYHTASRWQMLGVAAVLAACCAAYILIIPPYQAPDEIQHHLRALAVHRTPWVAGATRLDVPATPLRNPLTWNPNRLHTMVGNAAVTLSKDDVAELRRVAWWPASAYATDDRIFTGVASYPPLYYWAVFALGQAATAVLKLGPYDSIVAYRMVSALLAILLWTRVYARMRRMPDTRPYALAVVLLLALNPMQLAMSSSINPDAVVVPVTVLMFVAAWGVLRHDHPPGVFLAATWIALLTKPNGIFAALAVAGVIAVTWRLLPAASLPRAVQLVRWTLASVFASWILFYAWSPPRLTPTDDARAMSAIGYAAGLLARIPTLCVQYWGKLGWLEYRLPDAWYGGLVLVLVLSAAVAVRQRAVPREFARFVAIASAIHALLTVTAEALNVADAGLVLQGRYFLPASLALSPVVMHRTAWTRFVVPAYLLVMSVALLRLSVQRYYDNLEAFGIALGLWGG